MRDVLVVEHLSKDYGGTLAVNDISFCVAQNEIVGLAFQPAAVSAAAWTGSGRLAHGEAGAWRRPGPGRALGSVRRHADPFPVGFYPWQRRATGLDWRGMATRGDWPR